jgi:hypothetical protein
LLLLRILFFHISCCAICWNIKEHCHQPILSTIVAISQALQMEGESVAGNSLVVADVPERKFYSML